MNEYTIRMVEPEDLLACHTIEALSFPPSEAAETYSLHIRINEYPEGFLVAEHDGKVIGQVNSGSTSKDCISDAEFKKLIGHDPEGSNIVIFSLSVLPEFRSKGIGGKLLTAFIDQARAMGKDKVMLLCKEDLISYYTLYGFKDAGVSDSTHGGAVWHMMELAL